MTRMNWKRGLVRIALLAGLAWSAYCFYSDPPISAFMAILENHPTSSEAYLGGLQATKEKDACVAAAMKHVSPDPIAGIPLTLTPQAEKCYDDWRGSGVWYPRPYRDEAWISLWNLAEKWIGGLLIGLFASAIVFWVTIGFSRATEDA